jgi:hypothetical protein
MFASVAWEHADMCWLQEAQYWQAESETKRWWPDYSWGQVYFGATALLWMRTKDPQYGEELEYFAESHLNQKNGIKRTPCGLTFVTKWGSCRHAAGAAAVLACYAFGLRQQDPASTRATEVAEFAQGQVCSSQADVTNGLRLHKYVAWHPESTFSQVTGSVVTGKGSCVVQLHAYCWSSLVVHVTESTIQLGLQHRWIATTELQLLQPPVSTTGG